jgi:hypothetical protein
VDKISLSSLSGHWAQPKPRAKAEGAVFHDLFEASLAQEKPARPVMPKNDPPPTAPSPKLVEVKSLFEGPAQFPMRMRVGVLEVERAGGVERLEVPFLSGPGHNCSLVAGLGLSSDGQLQAILRTGDTRASRSLRGRDYVQKGFIGGRHDKMKESAHIALEEVAEEVGGRCLKNGFRSLGDKLMPTMPNESTEADQYFTAVMNLDGKVTGDGGGMELPGLIEPLPVDLPKAFEMMKRGEVGDGARCRVVYQRALDSIGYIPQLGAFVHDHPQLKQRWDSLGLGPTWDPRKLEPEPPKADVSKTISVTPNERASQVNDCIFESVSEHPVRPGMTFLDARTSHAVRESGEKEKVGSGFANYILKVDYDRAKVAVYSGDERPSVKWSEVERPVLAIKGLLPSSERNYRNENTDLARPDLPEYQVSPKSAQMEVSHRIGAEPVQLCADQGASEGQSDLRYHFFAHRVEQPGADFVPLREALRACREGRAGDAQSEGALVFLADQLNYIPALDMTVDEARALLRR